MNLPKPLVGLATLRSSAVLTTSFVNSTAVAIDGADTVAVFVSFTIGSLTSMSLKFQFGYDTSTYHDEMWPSEATVTISGTEAQLPSLSKVYTLTGTGTYYYCVPAIGRSFRVAVRGNGTVTNSLCSIIHAQARL